MNKLYAILIGVIAAIAITFALRQSPTMPAPQAAAPPPAETTAITPPNAAQIERFGSLAPLVGKTFVSGPMQAGSDVYDTRVWSWALGGTSIKIAHGLSDGSYGGDSYVYRNGETGDLDYVYVTNAGFATTGKMTMRKNGSWVAIETVRGHEKWTKVRSIGKMLADGTMESRTEYFDGTDWSDGRTSVYAAAPAGTVLPDLVMPAN